VSENNRGKPKAAPWVIVADGIHYGGGMERANAALAKYLIEIGVPVHLVSYRIEPSIAAHPIITAHEVRMPAGSPMLGMWRLDRVGRRVASEVTAYEPDARVLVNGSNCDWPDINWVHYVHHAWPARTDEAPLWYKAKAGAEHLINVQRERRILPRARILLANSERTNNDLLTHLQAKRERVHTIYLGTDDAWRGMTPARRDVARARFGHLANGPIIIFVGAMGYDLRKGFDTLWRAWQELCANPEWDANLVVAGGGRRVEAWKQAVAHSGLDARVKVIGFTNEVPELIAAADLLVSPVRYEPYGLNVQEALCCGVPAIVSGSSGVAEKYPSELKELLISDPDDAHALAAQMRNWRAQMDKFKRLTAPIAERLRSYNWRDMAAQIVTLAQAGSAPERQLTTQSDSLQ
jgi:glycosyltransferase involved in cell wall biosynthesis